MIELYEHIYEIMRHGISMKVHRDHRWWIHRIYHPVVMEINSWIVVCIYQQKWGEKNELVREREIGLCSRSANLNEMVSNIVDENCEFYPNGMLPAFSPSMIMPFAWSNGGQTDQAMQHMKRYDMNENSNEEKPFLFSMPSRYSRYPSSTLSESGHPRNIPGKIILSTNLISFDWLS